MDELQNRRVLTFCQVLCRTTAIYVFFLFSFFLLLWGGRHHKQHNKIPGFFSGSKSKIPRYVLIMFAQNASSWFPTCQRLKFPKIPSKANCKLNKGKNFSFCIKFWHRRSNWVQNFFQWFFQSQSQKLQLFQDVSVNADAVSSLSIFPESGRLRAFANNEMNLGLYSTMK